MFASLRKESAAVPTNAIFASAPGVGPLRAPGGAVKRGRLSSLVDAAPATKKASSGLSLPAHAPLVLDVHPYGKSAEDQVTGWPMGLPCWQVQITHAAFPSMTAFFLEALDAFLAGTAKEEGAPRSLKEFQQNCFFRAQVTRADGELSGVPLVPWRLAVYTAGRSDALSDLIGLLLAYARYRAENAHPRDKKPFPVPQEQKIEIYLGPQCPELTAKISDTENVVICRDRNLYRWCEAASPVGNKFLFMDLEIEETGAVALGWRGRTWPLRNCFDAADIPLTEYSPDAFVRVLSGERAAIGSRGDREKIIDIVKGGLNDFPCIVYVERVPADDGLPDDVYANARALIAMLRDVPHLFVIERTVGTDSH